MCDSVDFIRPCHCREILTWGGGYVWSPNDSDALVYAVSGAELTDEFRVSATATDNGIKIVDTSAWSKSVVDTVAFAWCCRL